jgi:putative FmdB family regulatory protein
MPIYEYACDKCGTFEVSQRITESPLRRCPTCKGRVRKLISSTSFQLKGSGWYVTDYAAKSGSSKKDEGGEKKSEGGEKKSEGGEKKSESADATKTSSEASKSTSDAPAKGSKTEATAA